MKQLFIIFNFKQKIMKVQILTTLFLAMILTLCFSSCTKEKITTQGEEIGELETETLVLLLPEGVSPETSTEWFLQLTESEIEQYKVDTENLLMSRTCGSWGSWSNPSEYTTLNCFSRCPDYRAANVTYASRSRTRNCHNASGDCYVQTERETWVVSSNCTHIYC